MAADGHLGMTALSLVTLALAGLSCFGNAVKRGPTRQIGLRAHLGLDPPLLLFATLGINQA